jgi:hypothetical protein
MVTACWQFATEKDGISALSLQRSLEIGSYQTAWAMLHRVRSVLVRPGRERLHDTVEVDEMYIGGDEPGLIGGRAKGKKALVGVAVERIHPSGFGPLPDGVACRRIGGLATGISAGQRPAGRDRPSSPTGGSPTGNFIGRRQAAASTSRRHRSSR